MLQTFNMQEKTQYSDSSYSKGVSQGTRLPKALLPMYVKVDERKLEDLLSYAVEYAKLLIYYDENLRPQSIDQKLKTWDLFFKYDISVLLATILHTNLKKIEIERKKISKEIDRANTEKRKLDSLKELFEFILNLARKLDQWYIDTIKIYIKGESIEGRLETELSQLIKNQLAYKLLELDVFVKWAEKEDGLGHKFLDKPIYEYFHQIWRKDSQDLDGKRQQLEKEFGGETQGENTSLAEKISHAKRKLRLVYHEFYNAYDYILRLAPNLLKASLTQKNDHKPHIALYIAFLKLFGFAQEHLNSLTERHLDYYYDKILQQRPEKGIPDRTSVCVKIAEHVESYYLEAGTLLSAGKNSLGEDSLYKTEEGLYINQAKIESLKSIFISKNLLIDIGSPDRLVANIYAAPIANSKDGHGKEWLDEAGTWSLFGEEQLDKTDTARTMTYADMGFAIASPVLLLKEGHRKVKITFHCDSDSFANTKDKKLLDLILGICETTQTSKERVFQNILGNSLDIALSSADGWLNIERYEILPPPDDLWQQAQFSISFKLAPAQAAIIGYDSEIHQENFDTRLPLIKIAMKKGGATYAYSFLRGLMLQQIQIAVEVREMKQLELFSDIGKLDPNMPFQPFGPTPDLGSYFMIGNAELFQKQLVDIQLNIEWHKLPPLSRGFEEFYEDYELDIKNDTFKVRLSALSDFRFLPLDKNEQQIFSLFSNASNQEVDNISGKLATEIKIGNITPDQSSKNTIDLERMKINYDFLLSSIENFDNQTKSGFFKLELCEPEFAFAHQIYPQVFTKIVTEQAAQQSGLLKGRKKSELKLPNPPYTPTIKSLSIDYKAISEIDILPGTARPVIPKESAKFFHIHPFGILPTFQQGFPSSRYLLPQYSHDGYLYIGLSNLSPPQQLSILFILTGSYLDELSDTRPVAKWAYLRDDEWVNLQEHQVLADGTEQFTRSGIVKLEIPSDIATHNKILRSDLFWIRIASIGLFATVKNIHLYAVNAQWVPDGDTTHLENLLPPFTIENLSVKVPEVDSILQPYHSFGGYSPESKAEFYTRTSERLRHKNRPLTNWDYERILLSKFRGLHQVKCMSLTEIELPPHMNNADLQENNLLVTVIPKARPNESEPKVNINFLQNIHAFLKSYASPFVKALVINPVYEKFKISCKVRFGEGKNNGAYIQKLNRDIKHHFCPWLDDPRASLSLGGRVNKDIVLSFIQKLPYVKHVTGFSMVHVVQDDSGRYVLDETTRNKSRSPFISASRPWSVLIPLDRHIVELIEDENIYTPPEKTGVNNLILGTDYVIGKEGDQQEEKEEITSSKETALPSEVDGKWLFWKITP